MAEVTRRSWIAKIKSVASAGKTGPRLPELTALWLGFGFVALVSGVTIARRFSLRASPLTQALSVFYANGQILFLALLAILLFALRSALPPKLSRPWLFAIAVAAGLSLLLPGFVDDDIGGLAFRVSEATVLPFILVLRALDVAVALSLLVAWGLGRLLRRRFVRLLSLPLAAALVDRHGNDLFFSYEGLHLCASVFAALLVSSALVDAQIGAWLSGRRAKLVGLGIALPAGAYAMLVTPPHRVLVELGRHPVAVLTPFPIARGDRADVGFEPGPGERRWYSADPLLSPRASDRGVWLPENGIVIMIGIDSLRADVLADEKHRAALPALFKLRDEGFYFSQARSPGSSTGPSLAAIFSGRYYSQQFWSRHPKRPFEPFPHLDDSPRFPELLRDEGHMPTVSFDTVGWLLNDFGIVRGFSEEQSLRAGSYPMAGPVFDALIPRIEQHGEGPLFVFTHLVDAHSPYNSVTKRGPPFERYLKEIGSVDQQIARLRSSLTSLGLWRRTALVVYSDHGEAFGEHGANFHGQNVYEELLRVPLIIKLPGRTGRQIDAPVSLVDIGPTVLDLYGLAAPATMMGQSLVPTFDPASAADLSRPIAAEARLKRALILPDGYKIIHDTRLFSVEQYDLRSDPKEEDNSYDANDPASVLRLARLKRFFEVHAFEREGYAPPFRRW